MGSCPGALFVALSRAKSPCGEGRDPDFAFHEDVLINNDRFTPVDTPTTRAREMDIERLRVSATQCRQRRILAPANREETFLRLVEWAQSQSHHWDCWISWIMCLIYLFFKYSICLTHNSPDHSQWCGDVNFKWRAEACYAVIGLGDWRP